MSEKIKETLSRFGEKWWGILAVYTSIVISTYVLIWNASEPLGIIDKIPDNGVMIGRVALYVLAVLLFGSHVTLILYVIYAWRKNSTGIRYNSGSNTLDKAQFDGLIPTRDQLIYEKTAMRDKKISRQTYASRVLLSLNSKKIEDKFARELLRSLYLDVSRLDNEIFTLVHISGSSNERDTNEV